MSLTPICILFLKFSPVFTSPIITENKNGGMLHLLRKERKRRKKKGIKNAPETAETALQGRF